MKLPKELEAKILAQAGVELHTPRPRRRVRRVAIESAARWAILLYPACRVVTETNTHGGWWAKAARAKSQREAVYAAFGFSPLCGPEGWAHIAGLRVTLTHVGPTMDSDNLQAALKAVRDEIAAVIGTDDGDPFYEWAYQQRLGPAGVEIRIEPK